MFVERKQYMKSSKKVWQFCCQALTRLYTRPPTSRIKTQPSGLYYKCFMIVIYDRNDSGQYYKSTIVVKASLS